MDTLTIRLPRHSYDIRFGSDLLRESGGTLSRFIAPGGKCAIVSDETVWALHGTSLLESFRQIGVQPARILLPPGEESKSAAGLAALCGEFAEAGLNRDSLVIAFGGGVIGDLCGFAAACYMRGIPYLQIPTTLLAQVDSSVGGKTAVNLPQGKNLMGAFWQPKAVIADTAVLQTLTPRDYASGMAEVVKYGAIRSGELFERLRQKPDEIGLAQVIRECCRIKAELVARDELDRGERILLNFGHTFGHGIEKLEGYGSFRHGEAVSIGMVMAAEVGQALGFTPSGTAERLRGTLSLYGLPVGCNVAAGDLLTLMAGDKKATDSGVKLVLLTKIGEAAPYPISMKELGSIMKKVEHLWKQ